MSGNDFVFLVKGDNTSRFKSYLGEVFIDGVEFECTKIDIEDKEQCAEIASTLSLRYNKEDSEPYLIHAFIRELKEGNVAYYHLKFLDNTVLNKFKLVYSEDYEVLKFHSRFFLDIYEKTT